MPRRQILSSEEKERLLVVPDDDVLLARMCFLSEHDLQIAWALLFYSVICEGRGFLPTKIFPLTTGLFPGLRLI